MSENTEYTKGPWKIERTSVDAGMLNAPENHYEEWAEYLTVFFNDYGEYCDVHGENQIANAQFIAVAPKMLQALENIKKEVLDRMNDKAPSKYVENIIAEAKGENCEA